MIRLKSSARRQVLDSIGIPLLFLLLSAIFLWHPILSRNVALPTDLSYRYDGLWKAHENDPGRVVAQNPILSDVADYYYPYADFAIKSLRSGHFPLWNPYILTGTPFFASAQAAVLDPVNLLTYTAGPLNYWTWAAWLRLALLGFGTYGFAIALGRGRAGGLAAGCTFMACGFVAVWLNYSVVTTLAWMPALFWGTTRALQTGRAVYMAAAGMAMGFLLLGGHPETQFLVGLAWAAYTLYCILVSPWRDMPPVSRFRKLGLVAGAGMLGLLLSAVQLIPFANFLLSSNAFQARAIDPDPASWGETILRVVVLLAPNFAGTPIENNYWAKDVTNFNEQTGYYGLLPMALGVLGTVCWARRDRLVPFLAVVATLSALLAVRAPGSHLVKLLPLLNVGHGIRWTLLLSFFGAVLAGYGVDAFVGMRPRSTAMRRWALGLSAAGLAAAALLVVVYLGIKDHNWDAAWQHVISHPAITRFFHPAHLSLYWPAIFLLLGGGVALLRWRGYLRAQGAGALMVLLIFSDLTVFGSNYNPVTPASEVYPPGPVTDYMAAHLGHDRFIGASGILRPNVNMIFGFHDVRGYEDLIDQSYASFYDRFYKETGAVIDALNLNMKRADQRLIDIAAVRYIAGAAKPRVEGSAKPFKVVVEEKRTALYENPGALPRTYVVFGAIVRADAAAAVLSPDTNLTGTVVLERGSEIKAPGRLDYRTAPVTWLQDAPDDIALEATLPVGVPGYLVLSDNYAPGWEAQVDKVPVEIIRANQVFRAVSLAPGKHTIEFHYRPPLVYAGAALSGIGLGLILAIALAHLRRARRSSRKTNRSKHGAF
ncbi:MAG: YfhO family protein [Chloroflexota bacterium]|nr:YfhO family protein [Chloroflexota bacterium]